MTFNCKFETPCGWCEKFDKECKEVCGTPRNDRFKVNPWADHSKIVNTISDSITSVNPMQAISIIPLSTQTIKGSK